MKTPDSHEKTPQGQCPQCKQLNPYTVPACQWCGARLPWAPASTTMPPSAPPAPTPPTMPPGYPPVPPSYSTGAGQMPGQTPYTGQTPYSSAAMPSQQRSPFTVFLIGCSAFLILSMVWCVGYPIVNIVRSQREYNSRSQALSPSASGQIVVDGPTFEAVDAKMDGRLHIWTDAQKDYYWKSVQGKVISWTGEVQHVDNESVFLKCNPKTYGTDVFVTLDGTQTDKLHLINEGQRITIVGTLALHDDSGYKIYNGHIQGI